MEIFSLPFLGPLAAGIVIAAAVVAGGYAAAGRLREQARDDAERLHEEARTETSALRKKWLRAAEKTRDELLQEGERRDQELERREQEADRRDRDLAQREREVTRSEKETARRAAAAKEAEARALAAKQEAEGRLQAVEEKLLEVAGMTPDDAKRQLIERVEEEARHDAAKLTRKIVDEARERGTRDAVRQTVLAMERVPLRTAVEHTIAFVQLPSDELKGRIIGREGRNIRAIENATGIDLIVDDTPGAILVSSFDPVRREIARVAIQRLVEDGRIHPARIEEVVKKVAEEFEDLVEETGNQAAFRLGISDLHPRLARLVGRLKFRSNVGHNLLEHSLEVGFISGFLADEFDVATDVVQYASLLHEIGRVDPETTGHTLLASAELAGKYGAPADVVETLQSLHPDVQSPRIEALLVKLANRVSENRPGARKDNLEIFLERLTRLEAIAATFDGVERAFAVKAGKELRVLARSDLVADADVLDLSKAIARKIERELEFPGQIRVHVIRETRAVEFAL